MRILPVLSKRKARSFTLLELIVVIVILGLLAALAIPTFSRVVNASKLESTEVTLASVAREATALSAFNADGVITQEHVEAAVADLRAPAAASLGVFAAETATYQVVFTDGTFSSDAHTISANLGGEPAGTSVGLALSVPGAGCAFVKAEGSKVSSWSSASISGAECTGSNAYLPPGEVGEEPTDNPTTEIPVEVKVSAPIFSDGIVPILVEWVAAPSDASEVKVFRQSISGGAWVPVEANAPGAPVYDYAPANETYVYKVEVLRAGVTETLPVTVSHAVTPEGVTDVTAVLNSNNISVTWGAVNPTAIAPLTGYHVYRSVDGGDYSFLKTVGSSTTSIVDSGLTPAKYCYQVTSYGTIGEAARSSEACTGPKADWGSGAPLDLLAIPNVNGLSVTWSAPTPTGSSLSEYEVTLNPGNVVARTNVLNRSFDGLDSSVTYSVTVKSVAVDGTLGAPVTVNAKPLVYVGSGNSETNLTLTGQKEVYVPSASYPYNIMGDEGKLYFAGGLPGNTSGGVYQINAGQTPTKLYNQTGATGLVRFGDSIYSISQSEKVLKRYSLVTRAVTNIPIDIMGRALATDGKTLFVTNGTGFYQLNHQTGVSTLIGAGNYYALTYDGKGTFYIGSQGGNLWKKTRAADGTWGTTTGVARAGTLSDNAVWAAVIAGDTIYFSAERSGAVFEVPLTGGTATAVQTGFAQPVGLATDGTSLFLAPFGQQNIVRLF